jgi:hypothetical protein
MAGEMAKKEEVENKINIEKLQMIWELSALRVERLKNPSKWAPTSFFIAVQCVTCYKEITHSVSHGRELDIVERKKRTRR